MATSPSRVLIFGATGYIGKHIARASLNASHPTFLFVGPDVGFDVQRAQQKAQLFVSLKKDGATLLKGSYEDRQSLVDAINIVDIVIAALGEKCILNQLKIIEVIKELGSMKRFYPSEYGMDPDHELLVRCPSPSGDLFENKRQVRRAIEDATIPYTYLSANCFDGYFLSGLAQMSQFMPPSRHLVIYGDGNTKVVWNKEEDIANYLIHSIEDPRAVNKTLYVRPPKNILSQNEVVSIWEELSGASLQKLYLLESEWLQDIEDTTCVEAKAAKGHFHLVFYLGACTNFDVQDEVEASHLYPQVKYTDVASYLKDFV